MKIGRLSSLVSGLGTVNSDTPAVKQTAQETPQAANIGSNSEAARVAISSDSSQADRTTRVAQLKEQVASGEYKPDSREVAKALARDLFA